MGEGCDQDQRYKQQKRAFSRGWLPFPLEMVRSSVIQEVLRVELLLLEMSRVIVLGIYRLPHWLLSGQVFQGVPPGGEDKLVRLYLSAAMETTWRPPE